MLESTGRSRFNTMRHSLFTLAVHPVRGGRRGDPAVLGEGQEAMPPPPHTHTQGCSANVRSQEPKGRPGEAEAGEPLQAGAAASANIGETAHSRNRSSPALEHGLWVWGEASGTGTTLHFILKRSVEPLMSFQWGEPRWSLFRRLLLPPLWGVDGACTPGPAVGVQGTGDLAAACAEH